MRVRIVVTSMAALAIGAGGVALLLQEQVFIDSRNSGHWGYLFSGVSLYCLAGVLLLGAGFLAAVVLGLLRGSVEPRLPGQWRAPATYQGRLIARFWYWILAIVLATCAAFALAERAPNPALMISPATGNR